MDFSKLFEKIYKRFNETTTNLAIKSIQTIFKYFITRNIKPNEKDFEILRNKMQNITLCGEGLIDESSGKNLFGKEAVNYLFWKIIHTANKENSGCNSREMLNWLKANPIVVQAAFQAIEQDRSVISKSEELQKTGKYAIDCYKQILAEIEKSLE